MKGDTRSLDNSFCRFSECWSSLSNGPQYTQATVLKQKLSTATACREPFPANRIGTNIGALQSTKVTHFLLVGSLGISNGYQFAGPPTQKWQ